MVVEHPGLGFGQALKCDRAKFSNTVKTSS